MNIIRQTPWHAAPAFQHEIRQVFDRFFADEAGDQSNVVTSQWTPRVDIREEDQRFVIFADIPGVDPKDIEVHMDKGILSLKGARIGEGSEDNGKFTRQERTHGVFHRRFALPDSADAEQITAHGKHGVLEIVIPKRPETTPRRIDISSN
ncbi:MAG TPA: Hsp20/alpha crystallin family protein [Rhodanobacteraceae bacterium]|nr:Hsp20/alpha crystallin family protein [Rhodanobacteraceae bacterium]